MRAWTFILLASCSALPARGSIVHRDPPDVVVSLAVVPTDFDLNADARTDLQLMAAFWPGMNNVYGGGGANIATDPSLGSTFLPFADAPEPGEAIGPAGSWASAAMLTYYPEFGPWTGHWAGPGPHLLALRFQSAAGEHFAWVRLSATFWTITLHDFAYESDPGVPIAAGAVPATATLPALAGLTLPLRRRRR